MIVDDNSRATRLLGRLLERRGYDVLGENDPTTAQPRAHRFRPDLVILDVCMPWKDGYEVAADLAEDDQLHDVPVIMMTGYGSQDTPVHSCAVLRKPFEIEDLMTTIEQGLEGRSGSGSVACGS